MNDMKVNVACKANILKGGNMKHISMAEIRQFRNIVKAVTDAARFIGFDEAGNPV